MTEEERERRRTEDYNIFEKFILIILWPRVIIQQIVIEDFEKKKDGYIKKHRSRTICVLIGLALYTILIVFASIKK